MPKKKPHEMTTEEAIRHLFPKKAVAHLKKVATEALEKAERKGRGSIKNQTRE